MWGWLLMTMKVTDTVGMMGTLNYSAAVLWVKIMC